MEKIRIAYHFSFKMEVLKKNGRLYKNHRAIGLGFTYSDALWTVFFDCKRKKTFIQKVIEVRVVRIAFAYDSTGFIHGLNLSDYPPEIPEDLNAELQHMPQKK